MFLKSLGQVGIFEPLGAPVRAPKGPKPPLSICTFAPTLRGYNLFASVPLEDESCNIVVFCLSLMGTNLRDFVKEANRVLKVG